MADEQSRERGTRSVVESIFSQSPEFVFCNCRCMYDQPAIISSRKQSKQHVKTDNIILWRHSLPLSVFRSALVSLCLNALFNLLYSRETLNASPLRLQSFQLSHRRRGMHPTRCRITSCSLLRPHCLTLHCASLPHLRPTRR